MGQALAFYALAACILGFGVLVITAKNTVHSIMFLVVNFLFIAGLYVTLGAQFLAVIQVIVYAGGIVVLYLFVFSLVVLVELIAISAYKFVSPTASMAPVKPMGPDNVVLVGTLLYTDYLVP